MATKTKADIILEKIGKLEEKVAKLSERSEWSLMDRIPFESSNGVNYCARFYLNDITEAGKTDIMSIHPYDEAEYCWAVTNPTETHLRYIHNGKVVKTEELSPYFKDNGFSNEELVEIADKLEALNKKFHVEPMMSHY